MLKIREIKKSFDSKKKLDYNEIMLKNYGKSY